MSTAQPVQAVVVVDGPAPAEHTKRVTTTTTTTTTGGGGSGPTEAPKGLSIVVIVFAGLGFVLGLTILIYAWVGLDLALTLGDDFEAVQKKCYESFGDSAIGVDSQYCELKSGTPQKRSIACGFYTCEGDKYCSSTGVCTYCPETTCSVFSDHAGCLGADNYHGTISLTCNSYDYSSSRDTTTTTLATHANSCDKVCPNVDGKRLYVCGLPQHYAGCSLEDVEQQMAFARFTGIGGAIAGSIVGIGSMIVSIPVLLNGLFSCLNKETGARVTGGIAIGMSVFGCCVGFICMICMIAFTVIANAVQGVADAFQDLGKTQEPCSDACFESLESQNGIIGHITNYYVTMSVLCGIVLFLLIMEMIIASVSCCVWKKIKSTVQPN